MLSSPNAVAAFGEFPCGILGSHGPMWASAPTKMQRRSSAQGRCPHRPVGTLIERSQETNSPLPQGLGPMWASAPTNRITRLLRWEACAAPHPSGLRPATLPYGGRLWEKNPPPGVQCTWEGEYLTAPSGARCGGRIGRGWGISPVCPAAYRKSGPACSAH